MQTHTGAIASSSKPCNDGQVLLHPTLISPATLIPYISSGFAQCGAFYSAQGHLDLWSTAYMRSATEQAKWLHACYVVSCTLANDGRLSVMQKTATEEPIMV